MRCPPELLNRICGQPLATIAQIHGKGYGVRATRDVVRDQVVIASEPLAVATGLTRFPSLVAQLAQRKLQSDDGFTLLLNSLCAPRVTHYWPEERAKLLEVVSADWLTEGWYAGVMLRLHLNCMRATDDSYTALYGLPSFLNHANDPNLLADFRNDGALTLIAARDIPATTELTISYVEEPNDERRRTFLLDHYGFAESYVTR